MDVGTTLHRGMYVPTKQQTLRMAILAWEIGRVGSGLGAKIGRLGTIIEELPATLVCVCSSSSAWSRSW